MARLFVLMPLSWLFAVLRRVVPHMDDALALKVVAVLIAPVLVLGHGQRMRNLKRLFGPCGWSNVQCAALSRGCAWHYARVVLDTIRLTSMTPAQLQQQVTIVGEEHLQAALSRKTGVLLIGNHIGNARVTLAFLGARGYRPSVVSYTVPIASLAAHQERIGRRFGVTEAALGAGAATAARRTLAGGGIFVVFSDVCLRPARGAWFRFGHAAIRVDTGPARLARMTPVPILRVSNHREPDGRYQVSIHPEIERDLFAHDPDVLTEIWLAACYEELLQWPDQWELMALTRLRPADDVLPASQPGGPLERGLQGGYSDR